MNERDRLIELIAQKVCADYSPACDEWEPRDCGKCYANDCHIFDIADHLIANNVTIPPVSVGQTIYLIRRPTERPAWIDECVVRRVVTYSFGHGGKACMFDSYNFSAHDRDIGKTVFLTREEAEQALKERSEKE